MTLRQDSAAAEEFPVADGGGRRRKEEGGGDLLSAQQVQSWTLVSESRLKRFSLYLLAGGS